MRGASLEEDLALRDFTVNAIAEPLQGGAAIDPLGGREDLAAGRLRLVSEQAFADDPLRVLRLVRVAVELHLQAEAATLHAAGAHTGGLAGVAAERIFAELRRILASEDPIGGLELMQEIGITTVVLPALGASRGAERPDEHNRYEHALGALRALITITADPTPISAEHAQALFELLAEPLADELTRGQALRWGALLSALASTPGPAEGGHSARALLSELRTSVRLQQHVGALVEHLPVALQLLDDPQALEPRSVYRFLRACQPVQVDLMLLCAAELHDLSGEHLGTLRALLAEGLRWRTDGPPAPLLRGDELASVLDISGAQIGELLELLAEAQYAKEIATREQALSYAHDHRPTLRSQ